MFRRCSNPDCQNAFDYRRGRLFRFHNQQSDSQSSVELCHCVRHFWLCDGCSRSYILEFHLGMGVAIRPRLGTEDIADASRRRQNRSARLMRLRRALTGA